ncbi:uncharacterized protein [Cicer arietinum]|uniref:uncharacterized protein isoform X2 n=1 Tax=Cicer arietinum TaxID=3827 RepID=UPI003CC5566A
MKTDSSSKDNVDGRNNFSVKSDVNESVPVELQDHVKNVLNEGEVEDEKTLDLSSKDGGEIVEVIHESVVSDAKWICKSPDGGLSSTASDWPSFNTEPCSYPYSLVGDEEAIVAVWHLQHSAIDACQKFLAPDAGSDCDEDVIEDEDEDEDEGEDESEDELVENCGEESEEYKFLEKVFAEDVGLRKYYEDNNKEGDFYCLVCGGIKKKMWKRFKDCVALIQHSTTILRTKRKRAHRAYAQVICKVVGWDIDQLPGIVLKDFDSSLIASRKILLEPEKPAAVSGVDDGNGEPVNPVDN